MRLQLRLIVLCLCTVAALAAGCSKDDGPSSTTGPGNSRTAAQCTNTIGNRVWFDTNCNGLQDSLETSGPSGVTVRLRNCDTFVERTTTTDATGHYSFTDVATGNYSVCIDIPVGYKATLQNQGSVDSLDSDIDTEGCTECTSYDCATDDLTRAAGLCVDETGGCNNSVGNHVWYDTNCNGIQDGTETTGPAGVKVTLRNCSTQVERTTTTDASGNYHFSNVATGEYSICIDIPDGYKATLEDQGADDGMDSDINAEGCTGCITFDCANENLTRDAGICVDGTGGCDNSVGNRVWYDTNCNGIQDGTETTGPAGVTVTLRNCSTQVERTTTTDASGNYHFSDVATGQYSICIDIPDGYKATLEDQGADDGMDSDINAEGCTGCITYDCASENLTRDAGICVDETGGCDNTVGSRVWYDTNCNGIQDKDETDGPGGVMVTLRNCDTQVERTTTTDASGNYHFSNVATGEYSICIDIPDGYKATLEDEGANDGMDSDINAEGCTGCRQYTCGADDLSRDAGLCLENGGGECDNTIGNRVWYDTNCNGIQDKDETGGPEGIKVILRNCDTGESRGTATDSNGFYTFSDVPTGDYEICIEIPGGFEATLENEGSNDGVDSDIDTDGCTGCHHIECGSDDRSRDAGLCEKKTPPDGEDNESCSPGFWRNHLTHWSATPYSPDDKVNATFGCDLVSDDDVTLGEAIDAPQTYGSLVFHAIAALLNASHPDIDFGLSVGEVMDAACAHDKETLATENEEEDCPLSGGNTTGGGGGGGKKK